jgi:hypothetical protein
MEIDADELQRLKDALAERQKAFLMAFAGASGEAVLADLARFCRANESCFHADARLHAVLEGRREVWLRIQTQLTSSIEELLQKRLGDNVTVVKLDREDEDG